MYFINFTSTIPHLPQNKQWQNERYRERTFYPLEMSWLINQSLFTQCYVWVLCILLIAIFSEQNVFESFNMASCCAIREDRKNTSFIYSFCLIAQHCGKVEQITIRLVLFELSRHQISGISLYGVKKELIDSAQSRFHSHDIPSNNLISHCTINTAYLAHLVVEGCSFYHFLPINNNC